MTIGQVPFTASLEDTVKLASALQLSEIDKFPVSASSAATVVTAAGATEIEHPSNSVSAIEPVTTGAVVSDITITWFPVAPLPQASVTVHSLIITSLFVQEALNAGVKQELINRTFPFTFTCFFE